MGIFFMQRACEDTCNDCYIELYNILLRAFISADKDFDGQVSEDEFEGMISAANDFPKKFGFEWWAGSGKDQFRAIDENGVFVKSCKDSANTGSDAYKKIYWFSWKCFRAADADRDGQVSNSEFATMLNVATYGQKRLGLPAPFQTSAERDKLFAKMDENGDGAISFDEWLAMFMKEIISPVAAL